MHIERGKKMKVAKRKTLKKWKAEKVRKVNNGKCRKGCKKAKRKGKGGGGRGERRKEG